MKIGSVFAGIGGLDLGLENSGLGETVWQVEIDPFCQAVLKKHWPNAKRYSDIHTVGAHNLSPVDVICGGFPCQDISQAGSGAGLQGARSGLWFEYARVISELQPRYVVIENVSALRKRGLSTVLQDLSSLGFDAFWDCIPASSFGAPHRRDRLYLVAWRVSDPQCRDVRDESERGSGSAQAGHSGNPESKHLGLNVANTNSLGKRQSDHQVSTLPRQDTRQNSSRRSGGMASTNSVRELQRQRAEQELWRRLSDRSQELEYTDHSGLSQQWGSESVEAQLSSTEWPSAWPPAPNDMQSWGELPASIEPSVCLLADEFPTIVGTAKRRGKSLRAQQLKALGNAALPIIGQTCGYIIQHLESELYGSHA